MHSNSTLLEFIPQNDKFYIKKIHNEQKTCNLHYLISKSSTNQIWLYFFLPNIILKKNLKQKENQSMQYNRKKKQGDYAKRKQ